MSYNGVGLSTPRGSGTNGHIQRNWSHLRARDPLPPREGSGAFSSSSFGGASTGFASRAPDAGILDHERRRRVEVQCLELQVRLEDQESPALSEQEIEQQVDALRQRLLVQSQEAHGKERKGPIQPYERHELAQAKALADEKLRKALGISKDHVEGRAFDRVEQERLKEARKAEWERKEEEKRVRQEERHKHQQEVERLKQQHELEKSRLKRDYERRGAPPSGASEVPPPSRRSIADWRWYSKSPEAPARRRKDSRSISPPPRRRGRSPSRSQSRSRSYSRSRSPPPRRAASAKGRGRSPSPSVSRSRSPISRSPSPRRPKTGGKSARSPSRLRSRSRSPRSRSASMSTSSSSTPPRSKARDD